MLRDLFINTVMVVAFTSVSYQAFRNTGLHHGLPLKLKLVLGGIYGLLGIVLMVFTIRVNETVIIDFRNIALLLSAINAGWIPAVMTGLVISIFRICYFGASVPSVVAVMVIALLTAVFSFISGFAMKLWKKWMLSVGISLIISSIALSFLLPNPAIRREALLYYNLGLSIAAVLVYYYIGYLEALTFSYRKYREEAKRDFLTGLDNVRQFELATGRIIREAEKRRQKLALLFIDVDFFKKVNDTYGHKQGDIVLKELGKILRQACRDVDIVSRNGGEEFSVLLMDCSQSKAVEIAERIRRTIEEHPFELPGQRKTAITVSIGIASYPEPVREVEKLKEKADGALYEAKRTGRNKVVVYE